jgi:predicted RNA-binding Zn ribbon-like protein
MTPSAEMKAVTIPPGVGADDMPRVRSVRKAINDVARARIAGGARREGDVDAINVAAAEPSLVPHMDVDGSRRLLPGTATQALSTIARDAIDLFTSPLVDRMRICAADDCGLLFLDASRPGTRRWCSMDWCRDRAKKRAAGRPVRQGYVA